MGAHGFHLSIIQKDDDIQAYEGDESIDYLILDESGVPKRAPSVSSKSGLNRLKSSSSAKVKKKRGMEWLGTGETDFLKKPFIPYQMVMIDGGDIQP